MNNKLSTLSLIASILLVAYFSSCKTSKPAAQTKTTEQAKVTISTCNGKTPSYTANIKSIIDASCASSCHSARNRADGIDLSNYEEVKAEAAKKRFMGSMKHESGYDPMPKKANKLDDASLQLIACWIENGMPQ